LGLQSQCPLLLPFFELLSLFNLQSGLIIYSICSVLAMAAGTALLLWHRPLQKRAVIWLLLGGSVLSTIWVAQVYALVFLFACIVWYLIDSGQLDAAGVCVGIFVGLKPNLGLWLVMLFLARYWRFAIISTITAVAVSIVPVLRYGVSIYREWPAHTVALHHSYSSADISIAGIFTRLGSRPAGIILALVVAAVALYVVYRRRPSLQVLAGIAICAGILCSPLAWFHYVLFAAPFFAALQWRRLEIATAAFFFPAPFCFPLFLSHTPTASAALTGCYFIGASLMLAAFVSNPVRPLDAL
jgi:hypothetical protein